MHEAQFLCWPRCWLATLEIRGPVWKFGWKTKVFVQNQKYLWLNWLKGWKIRCRLASFPQIISTRKIVQIMLPRLNEQSSSNPIYVVKTVPLVSFLMQPVGLQVNRNVKLYNKSWPFSILTFSIKRETNEPKQAAVTSLRGIIFIIVRNKL